MSTPTYELIGDGRAIRCLACGRASWNSADVLHLYCGACHVFHRALASTDLMFSAHLQHERQCGVCIALGPHERYDLYVGMQAPVPPTLVARYGDAPHEYETFNPRLSGRARVAMHGEHFVEALARADRWGVPLGEKRDEHCT